MSLFQCEYCGSVENTALSIQGYENISEWFDWTGIEDRKGKKLCSACGPDRKWHDKFTRVMFPIGTLKTDRFGNLEYIHSGESVNILDGVKYMKLSEIHKIDRDLMLTTWTNNKTDKKYIVTGVAYDATNERDGNCVVLYRSAGNDVGVFVRDIEEFKEKFTRIDD